MWHNEAAARQPESKTISPVQPVVLAQVGGGSAASNRLLLPWENVRLGGTRVWSSIPSSVQGMGNVKGMKGIMYSGRINPMRICSVQARSGWAV